MEYLILPKSKKNIPYVYWDNIFSIEELDWLQEKAKKAELIPRIGQNQYKPTFREGLVYWLYFSECNWVFQKLSDIISSGNLEFYNFSLTGFGEPIQLSNYVGDKHSKYNWHVDYGEGISRKLSIVLQLTYPQEYVGGDLQLLNDGNNVINIERKRGLVVMFPSFTIHRVTPVISGNRQSLVSWISGPPFK